MICPILSKTVKEYIGGEIKVWIEEIECRKNNCGFWNKKDKKCGIANF